MTNEERDIKIKINKLKYRNNHKNNKPIKLKIDPLEQNHNKYIKQKNRKLNKLNIEYNNNYIKILNYYYENCDNIIDEINKNQEEIDNKTNKQKERKSYMKKKYCKMWHKEHPTYMKDLKYNERMEVIYYYSNGLMKCKNCGETHIEFLEVDHIDNNGNVHRKENKIGPNLNWWIIKNNFPDMFQILCSNCNVKKYKNILTAHRTIKQNKSAISVLRNKIKVFKHYGGDIPRCECCKENDMDKLTLDHIKGDGADHKRRIGGSSYLIYDIIKNNYPNGYSILCQNCNSSIGRHGYCPHKPIKTSI